MNEKVGSTIQTIAAIGVIIGIIASIITGIVLMVADEDLVLTGLLIAVLGSVFCWISAVMTYGFGQLINNSSRLMEHLAQEDKKKSNDYTQQMKMYDMLKEKGLLTEEQYQKRIAEL